LARDLVFRKIHLARDVFQSQARAVDSIQSPDAPL
jgi:uncharacterized protein (DUF2384 family)